MMGGLVGIGGPKGPLCRDGAFLSAAIVSKNRGLIAVIDRWLLATPRPDRLFGGAAGRFPRHQTVGIAGLLATAYPDFWLLLAAAAGGKASHKTAPLRVSVRYKEKNTRGLFFGKGRSQGHECRQAKPAASNKTALRFSGRAPGFSSASSPPRQP